MSSNSSSQNRTGTQPKEGLQRRHLLLFATALVATGAVAATGLGLPVLRGAFGSGMAAMAAENDRAPNIIYIVSDDQGWKDVGFHGSDIKTPNIDRLSETGAELMQFYAQPMCTQTRAAMLTGRYPLRTGMQTAVIPSGAYMGCRWTNGSCPRR